MASKAGSIAFRYGGKKGYMKRWQSIDPLLVRGRKWRGFASMASAGSEPPLKGIRVLDMTRVLAGVSLENVLKDRL